jgi:excinuclease ABC subunit B
MIQADYNAKYGIVPTSIKKDVLSLEYATAETDYMSLDLVAESPALYATEEATEQIIKRLETEMKAAAKKLEFERATALRNRIRALKMKELELKPWV